MDGLAAAAAAPALPPEAEPRNAAMGSGTADGGGSAALTVSDWKCGVRLRMRQLITKGSPDDTAVCVRGARGEERRGVETREATESFVSEKRTNHARTQL